MIFYSTMWDGLLKLVTLVAMIAGTIAGVNLLGLSDIVKENAYDRPLVLVVALVYIPIYRTWVSILSSWLYGRVSLRAPITLSDAARLRRLFQLDFGFDWVPAKHVRQLPREQRRAALLAVLDEVGPHRRAMFF